MQNKRRDRHQRKAYALRRLSLAVDRMICASSPEAKARAAKWIAAWHAISA